MAVSSLSSGKSRSAFSLVELLVVCGAIAIFSATLFPFVQKTFKRTERMKCASNWRAFGRALYQFTADNNGTLPKSKHLENSDPNQSDQDVQKHLLPYLFPDTKEKSPLKATAKILCPAKDWGYGFNSYTSEKHLVVFSRPADTIYGIDLCAGGRWLDANVLSTKASNLKQAVPKPHSGQVNVLWLDGHVTAEIVSKLRNIQVTRDSGDSKTADETTFIGAKKYDR